MVKDESNQHYSTRLKHSSNQEHTICLTSTYISQQLLIDTEVSFKGREIYITHQIPVRGLPTCLSHNSCEEYNGDLKRNV